MAKWATIDYLNVANSVLNLLKNVPGVGSTVAKTEQKVVNAATDVAKTTVMGWLKKNWYVPVLGVGAIGTLIYYAVKK